MTENYGRPIRQIVIAGFRNTWIGRATSSVFRTFAKVARSPGAAVSLVFLVGLVIVAILGPAVSPHDPNEVFAGPRLSAPSTEFPLGTDLHGRDILSRLIAGSRLSLAVGVFSAALSLVLGILLGTVSGFKGGITDAIISKVIDVWLGFPSLIFALAIVAVLGKGVNNVIVAVGVSGIPQLARIVRSQVLSVRQMDYIEACRAVSVSTLRIMTRHVVPNVLSSVVVLSTLQVGGAIISAASLSFLGLGAQPPTAEWGLMLNEGREYLRHAWWLAVFPGLALFLTAMSINLLGDRLREMLDPRFSRRGGSAA